MAQMHPLEEDPQLTAIVRRFQHHEAKTHERLTKHAHIRQLSAHVAGYIYELCPDNRERAVALTKLEEVMMWANKSLAMEPEPDDAALMPTEDNISGERPDAPLVAEADA